MNLHSVFLTRPFRSRLISPRLICTIIGPCDSSISTQGIARNITIQGDKTWEKEIGALAEARFGEAHTARLVRERKESVV